jgi:hypothetical protein
MGIDFHDARNRRTRSGREADESWRKAVVGAGRLGPGEVFGVSFVLGEPTATALDSGWAPRPLVEQDRWTLWLAVTTAA